MTKFSRQPSRDSDNDDFNRRVTEWLSSRPEKPDCQLDSKEAVIRDFGYRKKKYNHYATRIGATVTCQSDNVHTDFRKILEFLTLFFLQSMAKRVSSW